MKAMVLHKTAAIETKPLKFQEVKLRGVTHNELLVKVIACGVCRTDLHVVEGDLKPLRSTIVPGHEIVGRVITKGDGVINFKLGELVGVPWLHHTCGKCNFCINGMENLCENKTLTGYTENGGYAEYVISNAGYTFKIPSNIKADDAAPLLCAGIIGYRAYKSTGAQFGDNVGLFGFGGSAHLTLQLAKGLGHKVTVVSRNHLDLAKKLGADEVYSSQKKSVSQNFKKNKLDSAIVFAPSGPVILDALESVRSGGTVVVAGIYVDHIPPMDYKKHLFGEKKLVSVEANTRTDSMEYLRLASKLKIKSVIKKMPLNKANEALIQLKNGGMEGVTVLKP